MASLYSREFFELVRSRLKPNGYLTLWLPAYQVPGETTLSIVRAFVEAFPSSVLLSGLHSELILMGGNDSKLEIDPALVQARLESMPEVRADLERIHLGGLTEIIGAFAASGETLARASRLSAPVTDDRPLLDHARRSQLRDNLIPADLFDLGVVEAWCPKCFSDGRPLPELAQRDAYLDLLARRYEAPRFLHSSTIKGPGQERKARVTGRRSKGAERTCARSRSGNKIRENHSVNWEKTIMSWAATGGADVPDQPAGCGPRADPSPCGGRCVPQVGAGLIQSKMEGATRI